MAEKTDVYVRIKYQKEGKIQEDDLLEDIDMYDAIYDMEYEGIDYEEKDSLMLRAYGRNYYPAYFEQESEQRNYLFEIAAERKIEQLYYIFCDFSFAMERILFGIVKMDIERKEVITQIIKEENYDLYLQQLFSKGYSSLKDAYEKFQEDELEEEELEEFYEELERVVGAELLEEFKEFSKTVNL